MPDKEHLWRQFRTARDNLYTAQDRYSRVIEDRRPVHVIEDAEADLAVAETIYQETARAWLAADRGDVA